MNNPCLHFARLVLGLCLCSLGLSAKGQDRPCTKVKIPVVMQPQKGDSTLYAPPFPLGWEFNSTTTSSEQNEHSHRVAQLSAYAAQQAPTQLQRTGDSISVCNEIFAVPFHWVQNYPNQSYVLTSLAQITQIAVAFPMRNGFHGVLVERPWTEFSVKDHESPTTLRTIDLVVCNASGEVTQAMNISFHLQDLFSGLIRIPIWAEDGQLLLRDFTIGELSSGNLGCKAYRISADNRIRRLASPREGWDAYAPVGAERDGLRHGTWTEYDFDSYLKEGDHALSVWKVKYRDGMPTRSTIHEIVFPETESTASTPFEWSTGHILYKIRYRVGKPPKVRFRHSDSGSSQKPH